MGTPNFAVPVLAKLLHSENKIIAVYTKPPSPKGRGMQLEKSPVHLLAEIHNIPVFTPLNFKSSEAITELKSLNADIIVVAAYGLILSRNVLESVKYGCLNIHPSALPRWRGAAPIAWTIMAGDTKTQVCIMRMDEGLDTGDIILKHEIAVDEKLNIESLSNILAAIGGDLVIKAINLIENGKATYEKQSMTGYTYARKILPQDEVIDWSQEANLINCKIRALSPRPGARCTYVKEVSNNTEQSAKTQNQRKFVFIKILEAEHIINIDHDQYYQYSYGQVIDDDLLVLCKHNSALRPLVIQKYGAKAMTRQDFLRGFPIKRGARFLTAAPETRD